MSGGGRGDGNALGTGVPGGVVETSNALGGGSGGGGEDGSGPLSGTFSGGDDGDAYGGFFTLQHLCSINPNPSSQMLSAISSLSTRRRPGSTIFLGDTGAVIHDVSSADCVYNRRKSRPWERHLVLGNGQCTLVGLYGDLDLDLHCDQDVRVTLTNVAVVPGLAFDIMSFNRIQEKHETVLNGAGASMLGGRVRYKKFRAGNFIQATRVPHDDASLHPPAMVAAMMRPGAPSSMNVNYFHKSLSHVNIKALHETAKQMGIKLTGIQEYCDGCAAAKTIKRAASGAAPTSLAATTSSRGGGFPAATPAASAAPRGGGIPPMFLSGAAPTSLAATTSSRGGGFPAATPAASAAPRGGGIPPMFSSGAAPTSLAATTSSRDGGFPAATPAASAAPRGGGIPPMFPSGAAPTSLAAATSSHGGGFPAATPAASAAPRGGGIPPMFSSGATTTSAATATSSHGGGTPAAVPATTTSAAAATSSSGGGIPTAVPAAEVTGGTHVSGSGVGPPAVVGETPTPPAPDPSVAAGTATGGLSATGPETYVQSHTGPHSDIWTEADGSE